MTSTSIGTLRWLRPWLVALVVWLSATTAVSAQESGERSKCEGLRGATLTDALQGRLPGVKVTVGGGAATGGGSIRIRGNNSVGGNDPLVYVDNIRISPYHSRGPRGLFSVPLLEFVDVSQIGRIEVLKGPTATIQYGDGAAAGVILIFTKRGGSGEDGVAGCEEEQAPPAARDTARAVGEAAAALNNESNVR